MDGEMDKARELQRFLRFLIIYNAVRALTETSLAFGCIAFFRISDEVGAHQFGVWLVDDLLSLSVLTALVLGAFITTQALVARRFIFDEVLPVALRAEADERECLRLLELSQRMRITFALAGLAGYVVWGAAVRLFVAPHLHDVFGPTLAIGGVMVFLYYVRLHELNLVPLLSYGGPELRERLEQVQRRWFIYRLLRRLQAAAGRLLTALGWGKEVAKGMHGPELGSEQHAWIMTPYSLLVVLDLVVAVAIILVVVDRALDDPTLAARRFVMSLLLIAICLLFVARAVRFLFGLAPRNPDSAFQRAAAETVGLISADAAEQESDARFARVDTRTGLGTHRAFVAGMRNRDHERAQGQGTPWVLVLIDVDHFKRANDTLGYRGADEILVGLARELEQRLCGRYRGHAFRFAGDELTVVLNGVPPHEGTAWAKRLACAVRAKGREWTHGAMDVTISVGVAGVAELPDPEPSGTTSPASRVFDLANERLIVAKRARDRVVGPERDDGAFLARRRSA